MTPEALSPLPGNATAFDAAKGLSHDYTFRRVIETLFITGW
jgi:hypothetical protein